jgi:hypothetical protein
MLAATSFAALLSASAPARAATSLDWRAPEGCPDARAVDASLSAVLGHSATDLGNFSRVSGTIEPRGSGWLLTIELTEGGQRSSRLISAERCDDLAEAAAVAIGLALEQQRQASAPLIPPSVAEQITAPAPVTSAPPSAEDAPGDSVQSASRSAAYQLAFGADLVLDTSSLPSVAPGVSVQARLRRERWQLALHGTYLPPSELALAGEQGVDFSLLVAGARACYSALGSAFVPAACAGFEAGRFSADGSSLSDARRADNPWLAPALGLELSPSLWRDLALDVRADLLLPLIRKHYAVNDDEQVFRPPAAALRFYFGLSLAVD